VRSGGVPVHIVNRIIEAAEDSQLTSPHKSVFAFVARHADDDGVVGTDDAGRALADARVVAAALGLGQSTVFKAFTALENSGYLSWDRTAISQRTKGTIGRLRIVFPRHAA